MEKVLEPARLCSCSPCCTYLGWGQRASPAFPQGWGLSSLPPRAHLSPVGPPNHRVGTRLPYHHWEQDEPALPPLANSTVWADWASGYRVLQVLTVGRPLCKGAC